MKWYSHVIITIAIVLFTYFFYRYDFGAIAFFIASIYLAFLFFSEVKRQKDLKK